MRDKAIFGAALLALQLLHSPAHAVGVTEARQPHRRLAEALPRAPASARYHAEPRHETGGELWAPAPLPLETVLSSRPDLTPQEERVSETATRNGDQTFLMVDKAQGKIILFEKNEPVFSSAALTGESTADRLPAGALAEKFSQLNDLKDKVTPAGRFTVSFGRDKDYGPLLDINEIQGKDWGIAIHGVYLGLPAEHRAERLQSRNEEDKHITFGCINVSRETIHFLLRELAWQRKTPLYILPEDETATAAYFTSRNS